MIIKFASAFLSDELKNAVTVVLRSPPPLLRALSSRFGASAAMTGQLNQGLWRPTRRCHAAKRSCNGRTGSNRGWSDAGGEAPAAPLRATRPGDFNPLRTGVGFPPRPRGLFVEF